MKKLIVNLGKQSYPIFIAINALEKLPLIFRENLNAKKICLITDKRVSALYGQEVKNNLINANLEVTYCQIDEGESSKQMSVYKTILRKMAKERLDRNSAVVALGGGVVGDLAGFVAATFMRGINYVQVPTTLLAQTDSSVGGKVGINLPEGKNLVGAFYQPKFVLIDPAVLATLESREFFSGMGEVIKYALIQDRNLFEMLENQKIENPNMLDLCLLEKIIFHCCKIKAKIVEKDERESGLRRILNFGHTPGHALEAATDFQYFKHGEAVIWGMRIMTYLSFKSKLISDKVYYRIDELLQKIPVPSIPGKITCEKLLKFMKIDKKMSEGKLPLVLISKIGKAEIVHDMDDKIMKAALSTILNMR